MNHSLDRKALAKRIAQYASDKIKNDPQADPVQVIAEAINQYSEDLNAFCAMIEATNKIMQETQKSFKQYLEGKKS